MFVMTLLKTRQILTNSFFDSSFWVTNLSFVSILAAAGRGGAEEAARRGERRRRGPGRAVEALDGRELAPGRAAVGVAPVVPRAHAANREQRRHPGARAREARANLATESLFPRRSYFLNFLYYSI